MFRRYLLVLCVSSLILVLSSVGVAAAVTYTFTEMYPAGSDTQAYPMAMNLVNGVPLAAGVTGGRPDELESGLPVYLG